MKQETRDALCALNRRFYDERAAEFSRTRERSWRGCERVLGHVASLAPAVLDVGCGNGRLLAPLAQRFGGGVAYTGVDASARLLALAGARYAAHEPQLVRADVVDGDPAHALPEGAFDLVAVLGLMHHVPGEAARRQLLKAAAARVAAGGVLALTVWRFEHAARLMRRRVPSDAYAHFDPALRDAQRDLDPGDHLLYWGDGHDAARYCHAADDAEVARWLDGLDLVTIDRFVADGSGERMNEYHVLRRMAR